MWRQYIVSFFILLGMLVLGRSVLYYVKKRFSQEGSREPTLSALLVRCSIKPLMVFVFLGGIYFALMPLNLSGRSAEIWLFVQKAASLAVSVGIAYFIYSLVDLVEFYLMRWASRTEERLDDILVGLVRKALRITIVIIVGLYLAEQMSGKSITTIITGLGIGGLAVALAAQDALKNMFGFIMILFDKPFTIGERIVIGDVDGTVEEMGFRSTRVRTLSGHLVTIPNETMANSPVTNIARRPYIRRLSNITITYDTPPAKVERAVKIIGKILDKNRDRMHPDYPPRVFFNEFNDWSLNVLMVYWFAPPDYWAFQEFNQKVNLEMMRQFEKEGIEYAFPTSTVYLANDERRQLALKMLNEH